VVAATTGVASFNARTGAVVLLAADVTAVGGALLASPIFTGNPTAPTPALHDNDTSLATTAYVQGELAALPAAAVTSFNTRTGAIVLTTGDITGAGGAPIASPTLTGTPAAPTQAPGSNSTALATTQFVTAAIAALGIGVASFNGRTGAVVLIANDVSSVGGAMTVSPAFSGNPTAPTPAPGNNTQSLATTAFVQAAISGTTAGVTSFNSRTGAVTLTLGDVTGVGGAPLASPGLTGVPTAPTAAQTSNDTTLATTAYVRAALAAAPGGVSSWNSRTGAVTLQAADVSAVGGALLNNPAFTGLPTAPTVATADNSTSLATTAWVVNKLATAGGVNSFNGRAGTVTLNATDIFNAAGAVYRQSDTPPAVTPNTLWYNSTNGQLYVQYVDPVSSALSWVVANSTPAPPVTYSVSVFPATGAAGNATTTAATFTTPANSSVNTVWKVRQQAAGAGGGGSASGASFQASGGGAGEFKEYLLSGVAAATVITLAIGNPGAAGVGNTSSPMAGGNSTLSFGTTSIVCNGGGPSPANSSGATGWQYPGSGGKAGATTAGAATVTLVRQCNGGDGGHMNGMTQVPSAGGLSAMGVPSQSRVLGASTGTTDGGGYGCGGAGGWAPTPNSGWNGQGGVVIIERVAG
jgi:hypothetical protein